MLCRMSSRSATDEDRGVVEQPDAVRAALAGEFASIPEEVRSRLAERPRFVRRLSLHDVDGTTRFVVASPLGDPYDNGRPAVTVEIAVYESSLGPRVGRLDATVDAGALTGLMSLPVAGSVLGAFDLETRVPLLPLPFDPALLDESSFTLAGDEWITVRRALPLSISSWR